jgi:hypothetical protein
MHKVLINGPSRLMALVILLAIYAANAKAEDWQPFEKMAMTTIDAVKNGNVKDIDGLLLLQERLMDFGVRACKNYARLHPEDAGLFELVINNAENMKFLSLKEIKTQWHAKHFLLSHGIAVNKLHQNSLTGSLLDTIVRPATAYIALREYRHTKNARLLRLVDTELSEAVFQLTYLQ